MVGVKSNAWTTLLNSIIRPRLFRFAMFFALVLSPFALRKCVCDSHFRRATKDTKTSVASVGGIHRVPPEWKTKALYRMAFLRSAPRAHLEATQPNDEAIRNPFGPRREVFSTVFSLPLGSSQRGGNWQLQSWM